LWADKAEKDVPITYVTNGVHTANWMARRLTNLFIKHLGSDWYDHLDQPEFWSQIDEIPDNGVVGGPLASQTQTFFLLARARP
jgi:starch phosphorylase